MLLFANYENIRQCASKRAQNNIPLAGAKIEEPTHASPVGSHGSPGSNSLLAEKSRIFLVLANKNIYEFRCDSCMMKEQWLKLLTLLTMFPYSVIPEEPQLNPISESFRAKVDPKLYGAGEYLWLIVCDW